MNKPDSQSSASSGAADEQAAAEIRDLFALVPRTYERINRILTLGLDGYWRWRAIGIALRTRPTDCLDICTGTGDMAIALRRRGGPGVRVSAVDFSEPMLAMARQRPEAEGVTFHQADVAALPLPEASFDVVTIAFALRNLNVSRARFVRCLGECRRVLREGGRLVTVETTQPPLRPFRFILHRYARFVIPAVGGRLSGAASPYAYLSESMRTFYTAPELAAVMREAGFREVRYTYLTGGMVAVHQAHP